MHLKQLWASKNLNKAIGGFGQPNSFITEFCAFRFLKLSATQLFLEVLHATIAF